MPSPLSFIGFDSIFGRTLPSNTEQRAAAAQFREAEAQRDREQLVAETQRLERELAEQQYSMSSSFQRELEAITQVSLDSIARGRERRTAQLEAARIAGEASASRTRLNYRSRYSLNTVNRGLSYDPEPLNSPLIYPDESSPTPTYPPGTAPQAAPSDNPANTDSHIPTYTFPITMASNISNQYITGRITPAPTRWDWPSNAPDPPMEPVPVPDNELRTVKAELKEQKNWNRFIFGKFVSKLVTSIESAVSNMEHVSTNDSGQRGNCYSWCPKCKLEKALTYTPQFQDRLAPIDENGGAVWMGKQSWIRLQDLLEKECIRQNTIGVDNYATQSAFRSIQDALNRAEKNKKTREEIQ